MADRLLEVADIAVTAIAAAAAPLVAPDVVERQYGVEADRTTLTGRRCYVFPVGDGEAERQSRTEVEWSYRLAVVVVEKYADAAGLPPKAWMDTRLLWARQKVFDTLNVDRPADYLGGVLWCHTIDRPVAYDFDEWRDHGCFWCEIEVELRELVAG